MLRETDDELSVAGHLHQIFIKWVSRRSAKVRLGGVDLKTLFRATVIQVIQHRFLDLHSQKRLKDDKSPALS